MSTLFLIICAVSIGLYTVFLVHISRPWCAAKKASVRTLVLDGVLDSALGCRFGVHREETMAELMFMRGGAVLLVAIVLLPITTRAQAPAIPAEVSTQRTATVTVTVSAQSIERLQQHLTELEAEVTELKSQVKELQSAIVSSPAKCAARRSRFYAHRSGQRRGGCIAGAGQRVVIRG